MPSAAWIVVAGVMAVAASRDAGDGGAAGGVGSTGDATSLPPTPPPQTTLFYEGFRKGMGSFVKSMSGEYSGQPLRVVGDDWELELEAPAKRYAVTGTFDKPVTVTPGTPFVFQYEVKLNDGLSCGGAYVKLLEATPGFDAREVTPHTPYVIMFGPDKCGTTDKVHFIIRWKNPVTGQAEEKHATEVPRIKNDRLSHLYTLIIRPDDTFTIKIDNTEVKTGSLRAAGAFSPPILPPAEVDDPSDVKPVDWVDEATIPDASAQKPEDWDDDAPREVEDAAAVKPAGWLDDEAEMIPDPAAQKPEEWDDEEDGEWVAPMIANPKCTEAPGCGTWVRPKKKNPAYRGVWKRPTIPNPDYKGPWTPRQIPNPAFFTDDHLHALGGVPIAAAAVEVWTMDGHIAFDNFLVSTSEMDASAFAERTWRPKHAAQEATANKESREANRRARLEAAAQGTLIDKVWLYVGDALDVAADNMVATAVTAAVILVSLVGGCWMWCSSGDAVDDDNVRRVLGGARSGHGHSHSPSHGHGHGAEDHHGHSHGDHGELDSDADDGIDADAEMERLKAIVAQQRAVASSAATPTPSRATAAATNPVPASATAPATGSKATDNGRKAKGEDAVVPGSTASQAVAAEAAVLAPAPTAEAVPAPAAVAAPEPAPVVVDDAARGAAAEEEEEEEAGVASGGKGRRSAGGVRRAGGRRADRAE